MDTKSYLVAIFIWNFKESLDAEGYEVDEVYGIAKDLVTEYLATDEYESFVDGNSMYGNTELFNDFAEKNLCKYL